MRRRIGYLINTIKQETLPAKIAVGGVIASLYGLYVVVTVEILQALGL